MEVNNKGGKRNGAGRKKALDPKKTIILYIEQSKIWKFGNEEKYKAAVMLFTNEYEPHKAATMSRQPSLQSNSPFDQLSAYKSEITATTSELQLQSLMNVIKADTSIGVLGQNNLLFLAQEHARNFTF